MRIFNNYNFDLKDNVKFKDTFDFIATFLKTNGLEYEQILFDFWDVYRPFEHKDENYTSEKYQKEENTRLYRLCKKYDILKEYYYNVHSTRSKPTMWNQYITNLPFHSTAYETDYVSHFEDDNNTSEPYLIDELPSCIKEICSKVPKPYSFFHTSVIFDRINWFENINRNHGINGVLSDWEHRNFQSNCILYHKLFDAGAKYNPVSVRIEVTNPNDKNSILNDSEVVSRLKNSFGESSKEMICVFDDSEFKNMESANVKIKEMIYNLFKSLKLPSGLEYEDFGNIKDTLISSKRLIPRNIFLKVFKGMGYEHIGSSVFARKEKYNYCSQISFGLRNKSLTTMIILQGHNFQLHFLNNKYVCNEETLLMVMDDTKFLMTLLIDTYIEKLFELYGKSPDWFEHSISCWNVNIISLANIKREYFQNLKNSKC